MSYLVLTSTVATLVSWTSAGPVMVLLATLMFLVLAAIAAIHILWAFGLRWPVESERDLVALVVGTTDRTQMPGPLRKLFGRLFHQVVEIDQGSFRLAIGQDDVP